MACTLIYRVSFLFAVVSVVTILSTGLPSKERPTDGCKRDDDDAGLRKGVVKKASFPWQYERPPMPAPPSEEIDDFDDDDEDSISSEHAHVVKRSVQNLLRRNARDVSTSTPHNYTDLLNMSMMFYEAQRSGALPSDNPISWRGDSALNDSGIYNEMLTGGYYDAGDHVKFGLPMAFTMTTLAWGAIRYHDVYHNAGLLDTVRETIKWGTDYFIKAHVSEREFYSQVGDGYIDHQYWGPPETMTMVRPSTLVNDSSPGSDVVGETTAALAAASIVFRDVDPSYSDLLLTHATQLYRLANDSQGPYNSGGYYVSSKYGDEIAWAAAWLYYATSNDAYLNDATAYYELHCKPRAWAHAWGNKNAGVQLLMWEFTGGSAYQKKVNKFVDNWLPNMSLPYTPDGLVHRDTWGPLRYAAGTCMIALMAAEDGLDSNNIYVDWARGQLHYMLGDNSAGQSYVIGYGDKYPERPHHRASSCTDGLTSNSALQSTDPNPNLLIGALVGGPGINDNYIDNREDYVANEVACDYNAAFQTVVAALLHYDSIS